MLVRVAAAFFIILIGIFAWALMNYQAFVTTPIITEEAKVVEVKKGSSFALIIRELGYQY
jgi:cell division protein YceG involved in septum cleavage